MSAVASGVAMIRKRHRKIFSAGNFNFEKISEKIRNLKSKLKTENCIHCINKQSKRE